MFKFMSDTKYWKCVQNVLKNITVKILTILNVDLNDTKLYIDICWLRELTQTRLKNGFQFFALGFKKYFKLIINAGVRDLKDLSRRQQVARLRSPPHHSSRGRRAIFILQPQRKVVANSKAASIITINMRVRPQAPTTFPTFCCILKNMF